MRSTPTDPQQPNGTKRAIDGVPEADRAAGLREAVVNHLVPGWDAAKLGARQQGSHQIDVIDMFSGCGGMSAGFDAVNRLAGPESPTFRHVLALDIDVPANKTYGRNLGLDPAPLDIHGLASEPDKLDKLIGGSRRDTANPLVLIGCAPCQGFSSHRNSAGASDPRNDLFVDFARIAARLQPDYILVENVPEILTTLYWPVVNLAREILGEAGYWTHLAAHNMAEFGVPQERYRALLTGAKTSFLGPIPSHSRAQFATVRDAIADLPRIKAGQRNARDPMHRTAGHRDSTVETIRAVPKNGGNRKPGTGPKSLQDLEARQLKPGYEDVYGRLHWDRPAITITAFSRNPASGRFVHPEQHRGLSIREAACLQGFPRDYQFEGTLDQAFRQIGNAVPPVFAAHLAVSILDHLDAAADVAAANEAGFSRPAETGIAAPLGASFSRLIPSLKAGSTRLAGAYEVHASAKSAS